MPVTFICPFCKKHYTAPDAMMGKVAKCPGCGNEFQIPTQGARDLYEAANFEMFQDAAAADFAEETPGAGHGPAEPGHCPACGQKVPVGSRICVACGHNMFEPVAQGESAAPQGNSQGRRSASLLPGFLVLGSLILAALSTIFYATAAYDVTLVLASITVPLGASAMALQLRRGNTFAGSLAALAMVIGVILFILSVRGKHAPAAPGSPPRPTISWHGGFHAAPGRTSKTLC